MAAAGFDGDAEGEGGVAFGGHYLFEALRWGRVRLVVCWRAVF